MDAKKRNNVIERTKAYDMVKFSHIDPINGFRKRAHDIWYGRAFRYPSWFSHTATFRIASVASNLGEALCEQVHLHDSGNYSSVSAYGDLIAVRKELRHQLESVEQMMGRCSDATPFHVHANSTVSQRTRFSNVLSASARSIPCESPDCITE